MDLVNKFAPDAAHITVPAGYLAFFDDFTDPMRIAGFLVLVLQGILITIKIRNETRRRKENADA